jgi:uncharacterized protein DUF1259
MAIPGVVLGRGVGQMVRPALLGLALLSVAPLADGAPGRPDAASIERLTGAKGAWNEKEGVFKVSVPRSDLAVTAHAVKITPSLGLTSWAAFTGSWKTSIVMGDMVLTEEQVNSVMSVALDSGLEVTGLHNHFSGESPRVMFLHVGGMGEEAVLAGAVGKVFAAIRGGKAQARGGQIDPALSTLDPAKIERILSVKGESKDGVYKVVVGRTARMHGQEVGGAMGVNTWAAFAGSDARAVVDGDFAVLESELQSVLKALRRSAIDVLAIHNHMTGEDPRIVFLHYWGIGPAADLARGVRAALDNTSAPGSSR